jgi:hypothetical protein
MKTVFQRHDFDARRQGEQKPKSARASSRKRGRFLYPSLDEFLSQYPVAMVNEYGEKVIYGRRVC